VKTRRSATNLAVAAGLIVAFVCPLSARADTHRESGITGDTVVNICPVQTEDLGCEAPYPTTIQVLSKKRHFIMNVATDGAGHFSVILRPGTYFLLPEVSSQVPALSNQAHPPFIPEIKVRVRRKQITTIKIVIDNGIR
jgi:hypothetical protein